LNVRRTKNTVDTENIQMELPMDVLCRLLRERNIVASDFRCLNERSSQAGWAAVKASLLRDSSGS